MTCLSDVVLVSSSFEAERFAERILIVVDPRGMKE